MIPRNSQIAENHVGENCFTTILRRRSVGFCFDFYRSGDAAYSPGLIVSGNESYLVVARSQIDASIHQHAPDSDLRCDFRLEVAGDAPRELPSGIAVG